MDHLDLYLTMEAFTDFVSGVKLIVCITIMDDYIHLLKQAKILKCIPFSKKKSKFTMALSYITYKAWHGPTC